MFNRISPNDIFVKIHFMMHIFAMCVFFMQRRIKLPLNFLPDAQLLININIIVPRFFENDADFSTDAIAPIALENIPKPTPKVAPNHSQ